MSSNLEIFFSYAWDDKDGQSESREKIVNDLYESLKKANYRVIRDKHDLGYKGSISEFMRRIGEGKCIIVVISEKYLKSPYCMFELCEIARNSNSDKHQFREKILPVMVEFIDFNNPDIIDEYLSFWEKKYTEWNNLIKERSGQLSSDRMQRYVKVKRIFQNFDELTEWLMDMNTLNPQLLSHDNFAEIKKAIQEKVGIAPKYKPAGGLVKKLVFGITIIAVIAGIFLITSKLNGKLNSSSPSFQHKNYDVVRMANEQLLIVQQKDTKRFGYAWAKDTSLFISFKYDEANPFIEGMARVKSSGKYQWIKPDSGDAFTGMFDHAEDFQNGKAKVINGKDSFYIDNSGGRIGMPSKNTVIKNRGKKGTVSDSISEPKNEPPPVKMCKVICITKGMRGVEVSFFDSKGNQHSKVSESNDLVFEIPCYLKPSGYVSVTFKKNDKSEPRNVKLEKFEIPELFRTNP